MKRYGVGLYTHLWVEVEIEAGSAEEAVRIARERAAHLELEMTDHEEIVATWGAETGDWECQSVGEYDD